MRERDRDEAARKRAARVGWKPVQETQASRSMNERLREMDERADALEGRLRRHAEENASWYKQWDVPRPE